MSCTYPNHSSFSYPTFFRGTVLIGFCGAKEYFFTGNTVIIDHGLGLFSLYAHLDSYDVKKGDSVVKGDPLGKCGKTGTATGQHLHYEININGKTVDPFLFLSFDSILKD